MVYRWVQLSIDRVAIVPTKPDLAYLVSSNKSTCAVIGNLIAS
ncbi:hypothetical protein ADIS_3144 [Lunatimonas lonarensis]|uniref:Uncharacterized protein n=1 Tax=Lunatimonas lonarensis TaxID=1232681 RepID=R7ZRS9_9BACT|nr:hypothetical protein ADIS_3144 [Lunatimonas lonarensis]